MTFQEAQWTAISHKDGPMLVLAGPGSGKTLVITERTKHLIEQYGIHPGNILVITFTKAAAMEMKERFLKLMGIEHTPVTFGTFHSIYFGMLRRAYGFHGGNVIREEQRKQIFREAMEKHQLDYEDEQEFMDGLTGEISSVKTNRIPLDHYYSMNCSDEVFREIYEFYEQKLRQASLLDFDDMLVMCYELLSQRQDILNGWQEKFKYILIDEYQDINLIQYQVVKLLAGSRQNLFAVGDDDQSIYRFRGANPEIMLRFTEDYKQAETVLLDYNFRSGTEIVKKAGLVIANNQNRYQKKIQAYQEEAGVVVIKEFPSQKEENEVIIEKIRNYAAKGIPYQEMAVIYRTNLDPRLLAEKLMEYNIPFQMKDSLPNIYEHWIAKNIVSYIHIALGSRSRREFLQVANRPNRYLNRESMIRGEIWFDDLREYYKEKGWMQDRIDQFEQDMITLKQMLPYTAVRFIREGIGYNQFLEEYAEYRKINKEELFDVLEILETSAKEYASFEEWFAHMETYGRELKEQAARQKDRKDSVVLTTMHSAKGLEYEIVFLIDLNEGVTPHKKALTDPDMEEERRMFYVGMTRAKKELYLYYVKERYQKKMKKSRFIGELLSDISEFQEGTRVYHKKYKMGTVEKIMQGKVLVRFDEKKKRATLDLKYCVEQEVLMIRG